MLEIAGGIVLAVVFLAVLVAAIANWRLVGSLLCAAALVALIVFQMV